MQKDSDKAPLLFDWLSSHGSNLWRLMGFSLLSGLIFVSLFYSITAIDTSPPVEVVNAHRIVSLDVSEPGSVPNGALAKLQANDLFLAPESDETYQRLDPGRFEFPFAQHHEAQAPKLLELRQEVKRETPTGLLVVTAPVLPPASALSLPLNEVGEAPALLIGSKIAFHMSESLQKRFEGSIPQQVGHALLGSQSYMKFLIGLSASGYPSVTLPISPIEMPSETGHYAKVLRALKFKPLEPGAEDSISWGHLVISWGDDAP